MNPISGGCLCGSVRYTINAEPMVVRACWCRVCQYFAAGNATINLAFPKDAVQITGELRDYASLASSGNHMHRRFCPTCGVQLFSEADERPHILVIRAGTLDDNALVAPEAAIWTASAPGWARMDPDLRQYAGQPPPPVLNPIAGTK
jgi:hypothetical protein